MDYKKDSAIHITPEIKPIVKDKNKKVTAKYERNTSLSEMDLLKEVNQKLDLLLTSLDITSTKEFSS